MFVACSESVIFRGMSGCPPGVLPRTMQDGSLTISGERKHEKKQKGESEIRVERFYGAFSRTFSLPENIDTKGINAEVKDGVLRVHVPKVEGAKSAATQIDIK
jgi:HSP20 family protein